MYPDSLDGMQGLVFLGTQRARSIRRERKDGVSHKDTKSAKKTQRTQRQCIPQRHKEHKAFTFTINYDFFVVFVSLWEILVYRKPLRPLRLLRVLCVPNNSQNPNRSELFS